MESAIKDLSQFNDTELFEIVSEGASHIVKNASRLNEAAKKLSGADDSGWKDLSREIVDRFLTCLFQLSFQHYD